MARIPARIPGRELEELEDKLYLSNSTDKTGELKIYGGTSGEKALEIFYGSTSVISFLATGATVQILGGATHTIQIGDAGSTSHSLASNDDLFISGELEVDGKVYFDALSAFYYRSIVRDDILFTFGSGLDSAIMWGTGQETSHALLMGVGDTSKSLIVCDYEDMYQDFDHAAQSNPTIFVHSNEDPDTDNTEWISISHDQTDGVIDCGKGTLNLGGTNVNFVNSTRTASTVTHDSYVTLEIGGTEYKFMLGA